MWQKRWGQKAQFASPFNCRFSLWDQLPTTWTICLSRIVPFSCQLLLMNFIRLAWIISTALNCSPLSSHCLKGKYFSWTESKLQSSVDPRNLCESVFFSMWKEFYFFSTIFFVCHSTYIYSVVTTKLNKYSHRL